MNRKTVRIPAFAKLVGWYCPAMKPLARQKLDVVNNKRSNPALRDWRGQFTPEFVFERGSNSLEFEGIRNQPN